MLFLLHPSSLHMSDAPSSSSKAGMDEIMKGRTVFTIAHRLSTVRGSNAIMVIGHGKIIERGSHDELTALKGRYYQLCTGTSGLG